MPGEGATSLEGQRLKPEGCNWEMSVVHLWEDVVTNQVGEGTSAEPWV